MFGASPAPDAPQFHTKEVSGTNTCKFCGATIGSAYYRVDQNMACAACAENVRLQGPQNPHAAFVRAMIFGIGAAIAGLIIYATFEIMTGIIIGYVSLLVGFMVGKAMMAGSGGYGGRHYQIAAVLLTYMAVSVAAVPVAISYSKEHQKVARVQGVPNSTSPTASTPDSSTDSVAPESPDTPTPAKPRMSFGAAIGMLTLLGLASPFLELTSNPFGGLIGLVILFVGVQIAWKIAAGKHIPIIVGPF